MDVSKEIDNVRKAAQADTTGSGQAHVDMLEAIRKLNLAVETPAETLMRMRFEPLQPAAIRMATESGVLEAIGASNGTPISAQALSRKTGYDALLIARIMRLVTWAGVCDEAAESEYAANDRTQLINTPAMIGGEKHHFDLFYPIGAHIVDYMNKTGVHQFPTQPEQKSPFEYTFKMSFWEFFERNPDHRKYFDDYMEGRRKGLVKWHETFPMATTLGPNAKDDPEAVLLVDVGGNKGHELESFQKTHPDVPGRLVLQDLPTMIETVKRIRPPKQVELMEYDFFTPQPIKGARAYYFRNICHDWSDDHCQKFLSNTAKSMEEGYSRILIDDYVLPNTGASMRGASMDFLMMMFCSGIERTMSQWEKLLDSCGLEIVKVWGTRSDYEQVIEAQLKVSCPDEGKSLSTVGSS